MGILTASVMSALGRFRPIGIAFALLLAGTAATAADLTPAEEQEFARKGAAMQAALAATGNDYPVPALFVKRWNLLAQALPEAQIATFTSRGHDDHALPVAALNGFDFNGAGHTYLQLGSSGASIEYVAAKDSPGYYTLSMKEPPRTDRRITAFTQFCLWEIRSTKSSFTIGTAVDLFGAAVRYVPPANATDRRHHAEAEGVSLTLRKDGENKTCEVKEAGTK